MITASYMQVPYKPYRTVNRELWLMSVPIDAPDTIPSGSHYSSESTTDHDKFYPLPSCVERPRGFF